MPILPIQAVGALAATVPLAEAAASGVTETFSQLLKAVTSSETNAADGSNSLAPSDSNSPGGTEAATSPTARLRGQTESLLQQFHQLLKQVLADHEIPADGEIHLQADAAGGMQVANGHAAADQIQTLMSSQPELTQLFEKIVANVNLLRLAESPASSLPVQSAAVSLIVDANRTSVAVN